MDSTTPFSALTTRWLAALRSNRALVLLFVVAWSSTLYPIWRPRFLPLLDLPNHLDAIAIWHRYSIESWGYSRFYRLNLLPLPYWGYFFPVHMMAYAMPIEIANKVYLSAYALFLPLGAAALAKQMGRSPALSLFAFPLVFNMNFSFGFITFCAGMTLMLFALVMLDRFLQSPSRLRAAALLVLTTFLYTTHVLPWLFFGVSATILLGSHLWGRVSDEKMGFRWPRVIAAASMMLPSVALGIFAFRAAQDGSTHVKAGPLDYRASFESLSPAIEQAIHRVVATWPGERAIEIILGFAVLWMLMMVSQRSTATDEPAQGTGYRYRLELLLLLACAATLYLPMHLFKPVDLWMIGGRFVAVVALFAVLLPRGPIRFAWPMRGGGRALLLVAAVGLHVYYCASLTRQWRAFDRRAAPLRRLCGRIPRGSSTLTLILGELTDPSVEYQAVPYVQFHAYAQFFAGGYEPWALNTGFPMVPKPGKALPSPRWKQPTQFRFDQHGIYYDYILIRGEPFDHQMFGPDDAPRAPLVGHDGEWRLYKVADPQPTPVTPDADTTEQEPEERSPAP